MIEALEPGKAAKVIQGMYEECLEAGLSPNLTRHGLNLIKLVVGSDRVQVTVSFAHKGARQGWQWNSSQLILDGEELALSDGPEHLARIMADPDAYKGLCRSGVRIRKTRSRTRQDKGQDAPQRRVTDLPRSAAVPEDAPRVPGRLLRDLPLIRGRMAKLSGDVERAREEAVAEAVASGLSQDDAHLNMSLHLENPDPFTWLTVLTTSVGVFDEEDRHHCVVRYKKVRNVWKRSSVLIEDLKNEGTYLDQGEDLSHALRFLGADEGPERAPQNIGRADTSAQGGFQSADVRRASVMRV